MDNIHLCELCLEAYEPEEVSGVRKLKAFRGYTVDLRLQEFRKMPYGKLPEFIEFASTKGQKLLAQMHQEVMQHARKNLNDLEKRLQISIEKFLKRLKQEQGTKQRCCTTEEEHEQHTVICDHCDTGADEGEITEIAGKWTCDTCYSKLYL